MEGGFKRDFWTAFSLTEYDDPFPSLAVRRVPQASWLSSTLLRHYESTVYCAACTVHPAGYHEGTYAFLPSSRLFAMLSTSTGTSCTIALFSFPTNITDH